MADDYSASELVLADFDVDGALEETAYEVLPQSSRGQLLRGAVAGAAALVAGGGAVAVARGGVAKTKGDISILRFDLVLEYLQSGLYTEAERLGALEPKTLAWARVVGAHERAHAVAIKRLLGSKAVKSPAFDFRGVTENQQAFVKTAVAFEELTAAILKWQAVRLDSRAIVAAAVSLHSVETRHAAWIRHIIGTNPVETAFDEAKPQREMAQLVRSTKFVVRRPSTSRRRKPAYTG